MKGEYGRTDPALRDGYAINRIALTGRNAWQWGIHVAFLPFPVDGETHPDNRQDHAQQNRRQHKPWPSVAEWIFVWVVHAHAR